MERKTQEHAEQVRQQEQEDTASEDAGFPEDQSDFPEDQSDFPASPKLSSLSNDADEVTARRMTGFAISAGIAASLGSNVVRLPFRALLMDRLLYVLYDATHAGSVLV